VFFGYLIGYALSRKGALVGVFLFVEFIGISHLLDSFNNVAYYLIHASVYLALYWWLINDKLNKNKQLLTCFLVALLSIGMAIDAYFYAKIETAFYRNYELMFMVVHMLFILSFIELKRIGSSARSFIARSFRVMGISHSDSFSNKVNDRAKIK